MIFTILWLAFWLLNGAPELSMWNAWLVALAVCLAIDIIS